MFCLQIQGRGPEHDRSDKLETTRGENRLGSKAVAPACSGVLFGSIWNWKMMENETVSPSNLCTDSLAKPIRATCLNLSCRRAWLAFAMLGPTCGRTNSASSVKAQGSTVIKT